ncbi:MAG: hypothetical protein MUC79_15710 [Thiobacillaceae bacterium]|jgi:hypothetical protein|nr:hypothetical protein [Thiobacillaceae bacterium]
MRLKTLHTLAFTALCGFAATAALADHNSVWGAGKANMPNDIHNAQIEGTDADGNVITDWRSFVSKGAGAETVNRYLDDDEAEMLPSTRSMTSRMSGSGRR